jgi:hypothetical protein
MFVSGALGVLLVGVIGVGTSVSYRAEAQQRSAVAQFRAARSALVTRTAITENAVQSLAAPVAAAAGALDASSGRVLDEIARNDLAIALATATLSSAHLRTDAARARTILESTPDDTTVLGGIAADELFRMGTRLNSAATAPPGVVAGLGATLRARTATTRAAVAAWQVEQDRLAAEAAIREAAAREAEAEAIRTAAEAAAAEVAAAGRREREREASATSTPSTPAPAAPTGSAPAPAPASPPAPAPAPAPSYSEYVWATGFQAELDACRGSVNMTPSFGTGVIGEHWSCGGSSFPKTEGAIVVLSGVMSGTYRVGPVVAVLNQHVDRIENVPQGYDLLYQTCIDGDNTQMSFTELIRAG